MLLQYTVFGGNGAINNGDRGLALCKALTFRWQDSMREWDLLKALKYHIERFKSRPTEKLTADECVALLPAEKRPWAGSAPALQ